MAAEMGNLENLIDSQQKYLDSIGDAIFEATIEGMKTGARMRHTKSQGPQPPGRLLIIATGHAPARFGATHECH